MTSLKRLTCNDFFKFNSVNLDLFTETYNSSFYLTYLAQWPEYQYLLQTTGGRTISYIMGKAEGENLLWHGHLTFLSVQPEYRRQRISQMLMKLLEDITEKVHRGYFVDLFVRESNSIAIDMYKKLGYHIYRTVVGYYSSSEDAFDMRKPMSRDMKLQSLSCKRKKVRPEDLEFD